MLRVPVSSMQRQVKTSKSIVLTKVRVKHGACIWAQAQMTSLVGETWEAEIIYIGAADRFWACRSGFRVPRLHPLMLRAEVPQGCRVVPGVLGSECAASRHASAVHSADQGMLGLRIRSLRKHVDDLTFRRFDDQLRAPCRPPRPELLRFRFKVRRLSVGAALDVRGDLHLSTMAENKDTNQRSGRDKFSNRGHQMLTPSRKPSDRPKPQPPKPENKKQ